MRDIWSEISYYAMAERWIDGWTDWLLAEFANPERTEGWWAARATHYPVGYWLMKIDRIGLSKRRKDPQKGFSMMGYISAPINRKDIWEP